MNAFLLLLGRKERWGGGSSQPPWLRSITRESRPRAPCGGSGDGGEPTGSPRVTATLPPKATPPRPPSFGDTQHAAGMGRGARGPPHPAPSLSVTWLVAPPWHRGAGGPARRLRKIKSFSEGRGDTRAPVIGNTSVTAWKVISAT